MKSFSIDISVGRRINGWQTIYRLYITPPDASFIKIGSRLSWPSTSDSEVFCMIVEDVEVPTSANLTPDTHVECSVTEEYEPIKDMLHEMVAKIMDTEKERPVHSYETWILPLFREASLKKIGI